MNEKDTAVFKAADILLPADHLYEWSVIACDQFTSQPDYWDDVRKIVGDNPSTLHMILPETFLKEDNSEEIRDIHNCMDDILEKDVLREYPDTYVYIERTLSDGRIRRGLVGKIDLETYDYHPGVKCAVRASEQTVPERIPPRMKTKTGSSLDLSHVILYCDDERKTIIEPLCENKEDLTLLYDFDLMKNGGHISGWAVRGEMKTKTDEAVAAYLRHQQEKYGSDNLLGFAVGDGNHSLASMKESYEKAKRENDQPEMKRYAVVELENIHDPVQTFEPIHRVLYNADCDELLSDMKEIEDENGIEIRWFSSGKEGTIKISADRNSSILNVLQPFLDRWSREHESAIDYIHGEDVLRSLSENEHTVGLLLPVMSSDELFPHIAEHGVFPRKAFSIGEANEKRYYLEAMKLKD